MLYEEKSRDPHPEKFDLQRCSTIVPFHQNQQVSQTSLLMILFLLLVKVE